MTFWNRDGSNGARARHVTRPEMVEVLEVRALLASGLTVSPVAAINATTGVALTNIPLATFVVTDPTTPPGDQRLAMILWGDGASTKQAVPVAQADGSFEILGTHTYTAAGPYTISVTVATPGDTTNRTSISDQVTVADPAGSQTPGPTPAPTPTPTPTPSPSPAPTPTPVATLQIAGNPLQVGKGRAFQSRIATITELKPGISGRMLKATIDWGDGGRSGTVKIKSLGNGQFGVEGSHRYHRAGSFQVTIRVVDTSGDTAQATSLVQVSARR